MPADFFRPKMEILSDGKVVINIWKPSKESWIADQKSKWITSAFNPRLLNEWNVWRKGLLMVSLKLPTIIKKYQVGNFGSSGVEPL